jgi:excisionase family DNA binding protein
MSEERLLTTKEAAQILGVHQSRIYALVNSGRLKATRFGNALVIKESDLEPIRERKPGRPPKQKE